MLNTGRPFEMHYVNAVYHHYPLPPPPHFPPLHPPPPTGLTSCQLHRQQALLSGDAPLVPQCQASGEYQAVQCDSARRQCWCVDLEGMELYGTRQNGKPSQCELVRSRMTCVVC